MATQEAKTWLESLLGGDKSKLKKIIKAGDTITDNATEVENPTTTSKLTGELVIENYPNLEEINLAGNEITKLIIKNCPKLTTVLIKDNEKMKEIDFSETDPGKDNKIKTFHFSCNKNGVDIFNFKNCKALTELILTDCGAVKKIKGESDIGDALATLELNGTTGISFAATDELKNLKDIKNAVKDIIGGSKGSMPTKTDSAGKEVVDTDKLKRELKDKGAASIKNEKDAAEKEANEAKENLNNSLNAINGAGLGLTGNDAADKDKIVEKIKELKNQATQAVNDLLKEINNLGLGLTGNDITKDKIFNKIKELINKPTTSCTHTDYDTIKAERDRLKTENTQLKSGGDKENYVVKKEVLVENTKENFQKWGISEAEYKEKFSTASAQEVETIKNELISKRFNNLGKENKTAFYLNIGLGTVAFMSLLVIGWLLMRETNVPKTDSENQKEPEKKKK